MGGKDHFSTKKGEKIVVGSRVCVCVWERESEREQALPKTDFWRIMWQSNDAENSALITKNKLQ